MRNILACLFIVLFLNLLFVKFVNASDHYNLSSPTNSEVVESLAKFVPIRFLPSHPLYFLIISKESLSRFFKPSATARAEFDLIVSGKRLNESYLLFKKGDFEKGNSNLLRYKKSLDMYTRRIVKASDQNQDVANLLSFSADTFANHEIIILEINQTVSNNKGQVDFKVNLLESIKSFESSIIVLDKLNPGIKNRFKILKTEQPQLNEVNIPPEQLDSSTETPKIKTN